MNRAGTIAELDILAIRKQFPILNQEVNGHPLVYFDNAATTQKPKAVIQALVDYYSGYNSNIHRGIHTLAEKATHAFEETRVAAQHFIAASEKEEIIFPAPPAGEYQFVCTYPGHSKQMQGVFIVK